MISKLNALSSCSVQRSVGKCLVRTGHKHSSNTLIYFSEFIFPSTGRERGTVENLPRSGRKKKTNVRTDRLLLRMVKTNKRQTLGETLCSHKFQPISPYLQCLVKLIHLNMIQENVCTITDTITRSIMNNYDVIVC
jgi:hypothetical protein